LEREREGEREHNVSMNEKIITNIIKKKLFKYISLII